MRPLSPPPKKKKASGCRAQKGKERKGNKTKEKKRKEKKTKENRMEMQARKGRHAGAETAIVCVIIASGTLVYSFRDSYPWTAPVSVLACAIAVVVLVVLGEGVREPGGPASVNAGVVWVLWLAYGAVFCGVPALLPAWTIYLQVIWIIATVGLTYARNDQRSTNFAIFLFILVLFIPGEDTIGHDMSRLARMIRVSAFYVTYVLLETIFILRERDISHGNAANTLARRNTSVHLLRSAWVLLVPTALIVISVFQCGLLAFHVAQSARKFSAQDLVLNDAEAEPRKREPASPRTQPASPRVARGGGVPRGKRSSRSIKASKGRMTVSSSDVRETIELHRPKNAH